MVNPNVDPILHASTVKKFSDIFHLLKPGMSRRLREESAGVALDLPTRRAWPREWDHAANRERGPNEGGS
jgi:hypothetical protein